MKNINLKGITPENITGVLILLIALINAALQIFDRNLLPITDEDITNIVSTIFLIVSALWNTWKNRNITSASQTSQQITDAIKNGEILEEEITMIIDHIKR